MSLYTRVDTPHGRGTIKQKDMCSVDIDRPELGKEWSGRWGVLHDTYPKDKPIGMYKDDLLYYWSEELILE